MWRVVGPKWLPLPRMLPTTPHNTALHMIPEMWSSTSRGDSGFCRDAIMDWCERQGIDYVFGLAKNPRLIKEIKEELKAAEAEWEKTGEKARMFKNFRYQTIQKTWRRKRRVVGKAEYVSQGSNPRFVVTSLAAKWFPAAVVYETVYCERGEMENRIKEQQLGLFADRTSTGTMRGNQVRLYFSSIAYILMHDLRRLALAGTELERAQCTTIRLKVLKIGAQIHVTVRRVWIRMAAGYPHKEVFQQAFDNLQALPLLRRRLNQASEEFPHHPDSGSKVISDRDFPARARSIHRRFEV